MKDMRVMVGKNPREVEVKGLNHDGTVRSIDRVTRTGTRISIRSASPSDHDALRQMFSRSSPQSIRSRFLIPYPKVPQRIISLLLDTHDPNKHFLLALTEDGQVIAHAMYALLSDGGTEAEMAIVVEDGWQSRGVGRMLLGELAEDGRRRGLKSFVGTVLIENRRMLDLIAGLFPGSRRVISDGAYEFRAPLLRGREPAVVAGVLGSAA